jgi:hypothetical protein
MHPTGSTNTGYDGNVQRSGRWKSWRSVKKDGKKSPGNIFGKRRAGGIKGNMMISPLVLNNGQGQVVRVAGGKGSQYVQNDSVKKYQY